MTRLVLHIGLPKTGSSAIQAFLAANADRLQSEAGLRWLDGLRGPNHTELAVACSRRPTALADAYGIGSDRDRTELGQRALNRLTRAARDGDLLVSSEHLASMLRTPAEVRALAGLVHRVADEVEVIAVLRRGDHWLPSSYAEAVRGGRTSPQGAGFVDRRGYLLDHHALLRLWTGVFGERSVRVLPYLEGDKSDPVALPSRFLAAAGVNADSAGWQHADQLTRGGLSATAVQVLRRIGPGLGVDQLTAGERAEAVRLLTELFPGAGVALSPAAARALTERGWIQTGIDRESQAFGDQWPSWRDEPPAAVRRPPKPTEQDLAVATAALREAGLVAGPGTGLRPQLRRALRGASGLVSRLHR